MSVLSKLKNSGIFENFWYIVFGQALVLPLSYGNSKKLNVPKIKVSVEQFSLGSAHRIVIQDEQLKNIAESSVGQRCTNYTFHCRAFESCQSAKT